MKWATRFKVVQLDYPLHFLTRVQSEGRYKESRQQADITAIWPAMYKGGGV